jgi:DNA-binding MarR family transcriptional regulator
MQNSLEERERRHAEVNLQVQKLFNVTDMSGAEIFLSLTRIVQLAEMHESHQFEGEGISAPRWRLMMYLFMREKVGHAGGVTPTEISHFQQVSKNTISSLLRGLEEQGFIEREIDPNDLRVFRIHLTDAGREHVTRTAPQRIEGINQLLADLTPEDIEQLKALLNKVRRSLELKICHAKE